MKKETFGATLRCSEDVNVEDEFTRSLNLAKAALSLGDIIVWLMGVESPFP